MTEWLLKLLGAGIDDAGRIAEVSLVVHGAATPGVVLALALVAGGLIYWMYGLTRSEISRPRRHTLAALRLAFLVLVLGLLLRPVLAFTVEGSIRRSLLLLFDASSSMKIKDPRKHETDRKRAALAKNLIDPRKGLDQPVDPNRAREIDLASRQELLQSILKNEALNLLPGLEKEFDLNVFTFGKRVQEVAANQATPGTAASDAAPAGKKSLAERYDWIDRLPAEEPLTAIGDTVREVISRKRGQPLAGIFLATDGANNSGSSPRDIAALARQEGVPLYIYGVGLTSPPDIIVSGLFVQEISFVKDEVPVTVRVRSQGMKGQSSKLKLMLGGGQVDEQEISFASDGELTVPMKFLPEKTGDFELRAEIEPLPDETIQDNNARSQHLRVIDAKIKILLVEQTPRWEFRYLQSLLMRDRRVQLKCVLFEGDPGISRAPGTPYLDQFPSAKEELLKYDLVILGDVDPKNFSPLNLDNLTEFVSRFGGSLLMIAGKRFSPAAYRRTVLEKLLPVEFEFAGFESSGDTPAEKPIRLELTAAGRASSMLRVSDREDENLARWKRLAPVFWVAKVSRAKPAAEVLLVDADPLKESRFGKMPVVAVHQYGVGQVMYVGTDNTWRWRKNTGDSFHVTFWSQTIQRLALQHLLGGSKRTQITADRQNYLTGDRITLYARLYSTSFEPVIEPVIKGFYAQKAAFQENESTGSKDAEVQLRPIPEQPGMYRGEFIAPKAGAYKFFVESDSSTQLDLNVAEPRFELGDTAMNEALLKEMAITSGGAFFREEDLHTLPSTISLKTERVRSPMEVELWSSPFYFLLMLGVVGAEWGLRKFSQLK